VEDIPAIAGSLAESSPDAVLHAGVAGPGSGHMLAAIDHVAPGVPVFSSAGLLARDSRRPISAAPATAEAYGPVPPASELPPAGRRLLRRLRVTEGPAAARPEALYGYEAMRLVLEAVRVAGPDRRRVVDAAMGMRKRRSPLGPYRLQATGDVEARRFALYALRDGRFRFERVVD
jgi:branched-chain amino acid transport system substrate-binding protein